MIEACQQRPPVLGMQDWLKAAMRTVFGILKSENRKEIDPSLRLPFAEVSFAEALCTLAFSIL